MSDNTILPERRYLDMQVAISELCVIYSKPIHYRMVYRIELRNISKLGLRLLGRKWTMKDAAGRTFILEADHVFNQDPLLTPNAVFSFGGFHDFKYPPVSMELRIFGIDQLLVPFLSTPCIFPDHCFRLPGSR